MCSNSGSTRAYQGEYEQLSSHGGAQYKPRSAAKPGSQKPAKLKTQNVQEAKKPEKQESQTAAKPETSKTAKKRSYRGQGDRRGQEGGRQRPGSRNQDAAKLRHQLPRSEGAK